MKIKQLINVAKTTESFEEYKNSDALAKIFDPYAKSELESHLKNLEERFEKAFFIKVDPEKHYGQEYELIVQVLYKGIRSLRDVTAGSMITNLPLVEALVFDNCILLTDNEYEKSDAGRARMRAEDVILYSR